MNLRKDGDFVNIPVIDASLALGSRPSHQRSGGEATLLSATRILLRDVRVVAKKSSTMYGLTQHRYGNIPMRSPVRFWPSGASAFLAKWFRWRLFYHLETKYIIMET